MFKEIQASKVSIASRTKLYGIGINDADYNIQVTIKGNIIRCPFYTKWMHMFDRCYSKSFQKISPSYIGCTVCKEWHKFSVFKKWMQNNDWDRLHLDKDIIKYGNKIYCPEYCCFVSGGLNNLLCNRKMSRGKYPLGVYLHKPSNKYITQCNLNGKAYHLGMFFSLEDAKQRYIDFKSKIIIDEANKQTDIRIRDGLLKHAEMLLNS